MSDLQKVASAAIFAGMVMGAFQEASAMAIFCCFGAWLLVQDKETPNA